MKSDYWFNDITVLFQKNSLVQFWPSHEDTNEDFVNSLTRFVLYSGLLISVLKKNSKHFITSMLIIIFLVLITKSKKLDNIRKQLSTSKELKSCTKPSRNNPLANRLPFDSINRSEACDVSSVSENITNSLFSGFPTKGLSDFNKHMTERQFFTTPNTGLISDQHEFAFSLYGAPNDKSCKENHMNCEEPLAGNFSKPSGYEGNFFGF